MALPFEGIHDRVTNPGAFEDERKSHKLSYGHVPPFSNLPLSPGNAQFGYDSWVQSEASRASVCRFRFISGLHQIKTEYLDFFAKMVLPIQKLANDMVRLATGSLGSYCSHAPIVMTCRRESPQYSKEI